MMLQRPPTQLTADRNRNGPCFERLFRPTAQGHPIRMELAASIAGSATQSGWAPDKDQQLAPDCEPTAQGRPIRMELAASNAARATQSGWALDKD